MKRSLIFLLIIIVVAGVLGTLIAKDPGYVLISYDGASLQTGIWVMLALLAVLIAVIYYLMRLFKVVGNSTAAWRDWRAQRALNRATRLTTKGMMFFQSGDFERAERFLNSGAATGSHRSVNFIYAAKAADVQGKREQRETYLRQAREADAGAAPAIAVASAEMALERQDFNEVLRTLDGVKSNSQVVKLKSHALLGLEDWAGLWELMPELRRVEQAPADLVALQKRISIERLTTPDIDDDALGTLYKKLPDDIKRDEDVAFAWCSHLKSETNAEAAIRVLLKRDWYPALVMLYGGLGRETLARRLKTAEGWLNAHTDDAALQLCLGELYEASGEKEKAHIAYQRSVDLKNSPQASKHLGRLLAFDGDYKKSNEYLTQALNLKLKGVT